jgi:CcmD family protein
MSEWSFVIAAFSLTWVVLGGYAAYVQARLGRANRALREADASAEAGR